MIIFPYATRGGVIMIYRPSRSWPVSIFNIRRNWPMVMSHLHKEKEMETNKYFAERDPTSQHSSNPNQNYTNLRIDGYQKNLYPSYNAENFEVPDLCWQQKDSPDNAPVFNLEHEIAAFNGILGKMVYPEYYWEVIHKVKHSDQQPQNHTCDTVTIGIHPSRDEFIIFDILDSTQSVLQLLKKVKGGYAFNLQEWMALLDKSKRVCKAQEHL